MSDCKGNLSVATKVDKNTLDYLASESERLGVTRAEFLRRLLDLYRESQRENVECPEWDDTVVMDLEAP